MKANWKKKYEDLAAKFEQYKKESIKWSVEDFTEYDQDDYVITQEQAQAALERMIYKHDCNDGITWDTVFDYITMFGTPKNEQQ